MHIVSASSAHYSGKQEQLPLELCPNEGYFSQVEKYVGHLPLPLLKLKKNILWRIPVNYHSSAGMRRYRRLESQYQPPLNLNLGSCVMN